ncbi:MAG: hypothetical protein U9Q71_05420, partial [Pseudomonadota bacterium]|nr:hypothetical protein [Pseudomonadota bacterium]
VQSFPAILPKLCLSVKVVSPASAPLRSLTLRVLKDEDVLRELTLDEKKLETQIEATSDLPKEGLENRIHTAHFLMVFSPFKLDGPCVLRVRAQTGSGELRGVGLRVSAKVPEPVPDE